MIAPAPRDQLLHDPLPLAQALIRAPSVTPADCGAQAVLADALAGLGFSVTHLPFGDPAHPTPNLFARLGSDAPHVCFVGHTDVVPPGDAPWRLPPFGGVARDGVLYGRGACDMKGAIACFVAAVAAHLAGGTPRGSISLLVTGDEEGPATDGTVRVLEWMATHGHVPDFCLVGEPTNPERLGEAVKIGRRGSLNARIVVEGVQGHVAYPQRADNPVHRLLEILSTLTRATLDQGSEWFEPSSLQVTSIDVGNPATNVIPGRAEARLNIRFNDHHSANSLDRWLRDACDAQGPGATLEVRVSGEAFVTRPGPFVAALSRAITDRTGLTPRLDTGGGTSDARFVVPYCPVAEFGLVGASMHKADENVTISDLNRLASIYHGFLDGLPA